MKAVIYDFVELKHDRSELVDGSDEVLREEERVSDAHRRSSAYGLLRRAQDTRRAEAGDDSPKNERPAAAE
ncbi:hypothetical protein [Ancylobacter defluvii]|uniref:Uncharacterized protein n=1 Tax=Ancylobacter defluvii TaxID=1282440 RepID=A0A9W6JXJ3_9HYPH|nr:hypothetical protein [Ancylobacter defluvii]MBS7586415.1 hypothetical protein [Ancylobacter defluvii]GLK85696.1 hypothetical protein GCM10017653_37660 [Ancylobacter defluvii]